MERVAINAEHEAEGCPGYLVSCLKQNTQKRCPHCAWKGFLRISLHCWHWYFGSMDTDNTSRDIPGNVESKEDGKDGRAIAFHLPTVPAVLIICKNVEHNFRTTTEQSTWNYIYNTFYFHYMTYLVKTKIRIYSWLRRATPDTPSVPTFSFSDLLFAFVTNYCHTLYYINCC